MERAALDAAIELGLDYGGAIPRGRKAESTGPWTQNTGSSPSIGTADYRVRTHRNVEDSDATLIIAEGRIKGGTALTAKYASAEAKPGLIVDLKKQDEALALGETTAWLRRVRPKTLNIAGPRESEAPGIYEVARRFLRLLLSIPFK